MSLWFAIKLSLFFGGILAVPVGTAWKHAAKSLRHAGWNANPDYGFWITIVGGCMMAAGLLLLLYAP